MGAGLLSGALLLLAQGAAAAPLVLPTPETRANWEVVIDDPDGRVFIDPASVRRDGTIVRFHVRTSLLTAIEGAQLLFARQAMDCARRTSGFEAGASYDAEGHQLGGREAEAWEVEMEPIEPGSAEAAFHERLCGGSGTI